MVKPTTKITPLDPAFHGESNYEVGLEDLLAEKKNMLTKLKSNPQTSNETLQLAQEELNIIDAQRRARALLPDSDRLAPGGKRTIRSSAARRLAYHAARPRHRQRGLCRGGKSCGTRDRQHPRQADIRRRPGFLGNVFPVRSLRRGDCRSVVGPRGNPDRRG